MRKAFVVFLLSLMLPFTANAATCSAGYYLNNGTCTECEHNNYCPGDDTMYACPAITYTDTEIMEMIRNLGYEPTSFRYAQLRSSWGYVNYNLKNIETCIMIVNYIYTPQGRLETVAFNYSVTDNNYTKYRNSYWDIANPGYYMVLPHSSGRRWRDIKACTNSHPANSHYSGSGTPDSVDGTIVDANDCPWECDDGYTGASCDACDVGYYASDGGCWQCSGQPTNAVWRSGSGNTSNSVVDCSYSCQSGSTINASSYSCETCPAGTYITQLNPDIRPTSYTQNVAEMTWSATFPYGEVSGVAVCNSTPGDEYWGKPIATDFPTGTTGVYCWCKMTSPTTSAWVYRTSYSTAEQCAADCSRCGYPVYRYDLFRSGMFGSAKCQSCTNGPSNSTYTASATTNSCPWACDDGYALTSSNTCEQLCTAGVTGLHTSTGLVFNLYANKQTSPAIHIMPDGTNTVCYTSLAPGAANNAVNVDYNGAVYHSID